MTELATTPNPTKSKTGSSLRRVEDAHLLVGKGRFTDNRPPSGQLHLHFIRSYLAHGRIVSIDKEEALQSKGVVAIYTAENLLADGIKPLPIADEFKQPDGRPMAQPSWHALANGVVRYVGEAVVAVVAESQAQAVDAAQLVEIEYDELPAAGNLAVASSPGAPLVWEDAPNNIVAQKKFGDSSLLLDAATNDYIQIPASSEFTRGTGDYTIEFQVRLDATSLVDTKTLLDMRTSATEVALRIYLQAAQVRVNVNGSDIATSGGNAVAFGGLGAGVLHSFEGVSATMTYPIDAINTAISNGNELPGSLQLTSEIGKTFMSKPQPVYNLILDRHHTIIADGVVSATLGKWKSSSHFEMWRKSRINMIRTLPDEDNIGSSNSSFVNLDTLSGHLANEVIIDDDYLPLKDTKTKEILDIEFDKLDKLPIDERDEIVENLPPILVDGEFIITEVLDHNRVRVDRSYNDMVNELKHIGEDESSKEFPGWHVTYKYTDFGRYKTFMKKGNDFI